MKKGASEHDFLRKSVAYHEAGHATAALILRHRAVQRVVIAGDVRGNSVPGKTFYYHPINTKSMRQALERHELRPWQEKLLENWICGCMAGAVAQSFFVGIRHLPSPTDEEGMSEYVEALCPFDEQGPLLGLLYLRTTRLIRKHWWLVRATAEALLERGTLSGKECERIRLEALRQYSLPPVPVSTAGGGGALLNIPPQPSLPEPPQDTWAIIDRTLWHLSYRCCETCMKPRRPPVPQSGWCRCGEAGGGEERHGA